MSTDATRKIYKDRAATAECLNAQARNRGLLRMPGARAALGRMRGRSYALTHDLMRMAALAPQLTGWSIGVPAQATSLA
jgi:hypothetical protein